jgi:hypothetical protein
MTLYQPKAKEDEMEKSYSTKGKNRIAYRILVRKSDKNSNKEDLKDLKCRIHSRIRLN